MRPARALAHKNEVQCRTIRIGGFPSLSLVAVRISLPFGSSAITDYTWADRWAIFDSRPKL